MHELFIDLETFSLVNLSKSGVYPYAEHPGFDILLFGYSIDGGPVQVVDLASGESLPGEVVEALVDPGVVKWAFNAAFERVCLSAWLHRQHPELMAARQFLDPSQWRCTIVWSAYLGLPMSLEQVAAVLNLPVQKYAAGRQLITQFCTPAKPTVLNGGATRNPPGSDPAGWEAFTAYNRRDVEVELAIHERLATFPMPEAEWDTYALDQQINDTGILLDAILVDNAVECDRQHRAATLARAQELTGLENPNSPIQPKSASPKVVFSEPNAPNTFNSRAGRNVTNRPLTKPPAIAPRRPPVALPYTPAAPPVKKCGTKPGRINAKPNPGPNTVPSNNKPISPPVKLARKPISTAFCA